MGSAVQQRAGRVLGSRAIFDKFRVTGLAQRRYFAGLVHDGDHLTRRLGVCLRMRPCNRAWLATECPAGFAFVFAGECGLFEIAKTIKQDCLCGIFADITISSETGDYAGS